MNMPLFREHVLHTVWRLAEHSAWATEGRRIRYATLDNNWRVKIWCSWKGLMMSVTLPARPGHVLGDCHDWQSDTVSAEEHEMLLAVAVVAGCAAPRPPRHTRQADRLVVGA